MPRRNRNVVRIHPRKRAVPANGYYAGDQDNVEKLRQITSQDLDPRSVLIKALDDGITEAVVLGFDKDGDFYFASNKASGGDVLWLLERAKHRLMQVTDELEAAK